MPLVGLRRVGATSRSSFYEVLLVGQLRGIRGGAMHIPREGEESLR